jgi:starvation-inducible DNA-binding protein
MTVRVSSNSDSFPVAFRPTAIHKQEHEMPEGAGDMMLAASLRRLLADAVTLYLRAHGFHWNVVGPDFAQYHDLFSSIYSDVHGSVDSIAENIRKLNAISPFRLPEFMALRSLVDQPVEAPLPAAMAADLLNGNEQILVTLNNAFAIANASNQQGIANFLAERIDQHMKWSWQLRSSLVA